MTTPLASVMPQPVRDAQDRAFTVGYLIHLDRSEGGPNKLMGLVLPPFQRPPIWTEEQQTRFVESLWLGLPVGTYCVNRPLTDGHPTDGWLLDGQQRIRSIAAFLRDEILAFGFLWSEVPRVDQRRFENSLFGCSEIRQEDELRLLDIYNRLAYGGTPHAVGGAR